MKQPLKDLKAERERQGLTQTELGLRVGMRLGSARSQISRAEGGKGSFSIGMIERMAAALGCSVEVTITVKRPHADALGDVLGDLDQLAALTAERDAARADLARYTAVYGDPDAPVEPPAPDLDMGTPLLPGLADLILAAPQIKVGDYVRCESLGGVTGIVTSVRPTPNAGGYGCIMRDDETGHEWFASAELLEVIR